MPEELKKTDFDPHLNSKFEITSKLSGKIEVELVQIDEKNTDETEVFSLLFKGPKDLVLPQDTHTVKHEKMGEFSIFLGPVIHHEQDGVYYEAIFNRLKKKK
jgi:hypothetical protein